MADKCSESAAFLTDGAFAKRHPRKVTVMLFLFCETYFLQRFAGDALTEALFEELLPRNRFSLQFPTFVKRSVVAYFL
jgi:hypothetical protein